MVEKAIRYVAIIKNRDIKELNNSFKQMKIMMKDNNFPSLSGIADTGNGHFKFTGKIGQRHYQFASNSVA